MIGGATAGRSPRARGRAALLTLAVSLGAAAPTLAGWSWTRTVEVPGRQGVACTGDGYVVSGTRHLVRVDRDGTTLAANEAPFDGWFPDGNHLGDVAHHDGAIYASAERFADGRGHDMQVAVYDAKTLAFVRSFPVDAGSGQVELSGVAVDGAADRVWLSDWTDGTWLYRYRLSDGAPAGRLHLHPRPEKTQGVAAGPWGLLVTADDGDAELGLPDHVYRLAEPDHPHTSAVVLELELTDVALTGEIEGLCVDPSTGELVVHSNRGMRVVEGIPAGLVDGYEREVSELVVFRPSDPE